MMKRAWCAVGITLALLVAPLAVVAAQPLGLGGSECLRAGVCVLGSPAGYDLGRLNVGWYQNWTVQVHPPCPGGVEFVQTIRLRDDAATPQYDLWPPNWDTVAQAIAANPGALWLVGNEPDVETQDNCLPAEYAARYHECYAFIKGRDPSARLSAAAIVQATPLRLRWLDQVLASYQAQFGVPLPVDAWNIHVQIMPEVRDGWGCEIPPGLPDAQGTVYDLQQNASVEVFRDQVTAFRVWMRDRGYRQLPLVISEYGALMPSGHGYLGWGDEAAGNQMVSDYLAGTFAFCLTAHDPALGYSADGDRLVQRWAWYSLNDRLPWFNGNLFGGGFNGSLYIAQGQPGAGSLTMFGQRYAAVTGALRCRAMQLPVVTVSDGWLTVWQLSRSTAP